MIPLLSLGACLYRPPIANMAMPQNRGDLIVAAGYGPLPGVTGAYAITDHVDLRAAVGASVVIGGDAAQYRADLGAGWFWAPGVDADARAAGRRGDGMRVGASFDVGGGHVFDTAYRCDVDLWNDCPDAEPDHPVYTLSAYTLFGTAQLQVGYESRWFQGGLATQFVGMHLFSDASSWKVDVTPPDCLYFQPVLMLRAGLSPVFVEAQLGLSLALYSGKSSAGLYSYPYMGSIGLAFDFDRLGQGRKAVDWGPQP